jgi:hypothetical protein
MYRCDICGCVVPPGTTAITRAVETREREYPDRRHTAHQAKTARRRSQRMVGDRGGCGREIVREHQVCPSCFEACEADHSEGREIETGATQPE